LFLKANEKHFNMKKQIQIITMLLLLIAGMQSCQPKDFKSVGSPTTPMASLIGSWKLNRVTQVDENAKYLAFTNSSINVQQQDITNVYPFNTFKITLNGNGTTPTTFVVDPGTAPVIVSINSGNWTVNDPDYPTKITVTNGTVSQVLTIAAYPTAEDPTFKLVKEKRDATSNKLLTSYNYEFVKQ